MFGDFLLDSGAFTFMMNSKKHVDWDGYLKRYADFIIRNDIKKFFELDIDSVVGYKKVLEYRQRLEDLTERPCIPVWHKSRGIKAFEEDSKNYGYVAVGGIVSREIKPPEYKAFPQLIRIAHDNGAMIHGLGFTNLEGMKKYHFDSVDSTAWTTGNRFGYIYKFDGQTMRKIKTPKGMRIGDPRKAASTRSIIYKEKRMEKAVVLLSGGVDSSTCLGLAVEKYGSSVLALNIFSFT